MMRGKILIASKNEKDIERFAGELGNEFEVESAKSSEEIMDKTFENEYRCVAVDAVENELTEAVMKLLEYDASVTAVVYNAHDLEDMEDFFSMGVVDVALGTVEEAILRVRKITSDGKSGKTILLGNIEMDPRDRTIKDAEGNTRSIGDVQFDVLMTLGENRGEVVYKERLKSLMNNPSDVALRVTINKLKTRFGLDIRSVRGKGYVLY